MPTYIAILRSFIITPNQTASRVSDNAFRQLPFKQINYNHMQQNASQRRCCPCIMQASAGAVPALFNTLLWSFHKIYFISCFNKICIVGYRWLPTKCWDFSLSRDSDISISKCPTLYLYTKMTITDSFLQLVAIQISYDYFRGWGVRKGHNIITLFSNFTYGAQTVSRHIWSCKLGKSKIFKRL